MVLIEDIAAFLDAALYADRIGDEHSGIVQEANSAVIRLGLALQAGPGLADWAEQERLDALFLHRWWGWETHRLPESLGVLGYHLPFDLSLTTGWNPRLADALGMSAWEEIGEKDGFPLGMVGPVPDCPPADSEARVRTVFGGWDEMVPGTRTTIRRVAVMGAMTDALVREAAERGADLYLTGQMRQPGRAAVADTGLHLIALGPQRGERWGLRTLAHLLRERFWNLEVVLKPSGQDTL